jgi:hypothetical protein
VTRRTFFEAMPLRRCSTQVACSQVHGEVHARHHAGRYHRAPWRDLVATSPDHSDCPAAISPEAPERFVDQERGPYVRLEHGEHVLPEGVGPLQKNTSAPMIPRA